MCANILLITSQGLRDQKTIYAILSFGCKKKNESERGDESHPFLLFFFFTINTERPLSAEIHGRDNDVLKDQSEHAAW